MYYNCSELLQLAQQHNCCLWEIILRNEQTINDCTEDEIFNKLELRYQVMCRSAKRALTQQLQTTGGLITGIANRQYLHAQTGKTICGAFMNMVMATALSCSEVNASMGEICAAPTAGACGILPAILVCFETERQVEHKVVLQGLLTAAGIGAIITKNATVSGAEGGCQAECGVGAAMSAAAAVHMMGGDREQCIHALSMALINCMGLICDPVAGLVQVPCAIRNASQAANALASADLALSGTTSIIPADEVIEAMYKVGRSLSTDLRETSLGGIAVSKTAKNIAASFG